MISTRLLCAAAALAVAPAASAQPDPGGAADRTPAAVVDHHMKALAAGDLDGLVSDYADDAVLISPGQTAEGKDALRSVYEGMIESKADPKPVFKALKIWGQGDIGFVSWEIDQGDKAQSNGTDAFLVRHNRILVQSVFQGVGPPAEQ